MKPLVIVGCGGMGREVHDIVDALNAVSPTWDLLGYVDDSPTAENSRLVESRGSRVLGPVSVVDQLDPVVTYVIGIGSGTVRRVIDTALTGQKREAAVLIHPSVTLGHDVRIEPGAVLCPGARVTTNIHLGRHVILNNNVTIGHDSDLEAYVTVNPLGAVSGGVTLREGVTIGANAVVLQNLVVGAGSTVGAGACVVRDVADGIIVKGVPAR